MRPSCFWRRLALLALPAVLGLGAAGCHTYKYYDIHVAFSSMPNNGMPGFTGATAFSVQVCRVTVTGADKDQFTLPHGDPVHGANPDQKCPNLSNSGDPLDGGKFEFSTFADSGNLTFTLDAFQDLQETDGCKIGSGTATFPVSGMITTAGELPIMKQAVSCVDTGQHQGDANGLPD